MSAFSLRTVSIIIPFYKYLAYLKQCISGLQRRMVHPIHEVIIVSDGSPELALLTAYVEEIRSKISFSIKLIARAENRGFAFTCNEGARHANGDFLLFLNEDIVPVTGWLMAMMQFLNQHPEAGILGSRLLYPEINLIQHAGGAFDKEGNPIHIYKGQPAFLPFLSKNRKLQWVTAACLLISQTDFREVSGFDESYITSSEDVDICFKVRFQLNKEVWLVSDSILYHYSDVTGATSGNIDRTHRLFLQRWSSEIIRDEEQIYEEDGFSPELLKLFEQCGVYKDFAAIYMLKEAVSPPEADRGGEYVKMWSPAELREELDHLRLRFPGYQFSRHSGLAPEIPLESKPGAAAGETTSLDKFLIQRLTSALAIPGLTSAEKETLFSQLFEKLNSIQFFNYLYNVASVLERNGDKINAENLFSFICRFAEKTNAPLAGKAYFKRSELSRDLQRKKDYLHSSLKLAPDHSKARSNLEYIMKMETQEVRMIQRLADIPAGSAVALYGAGSAGQNMLKIIRMFRPDLKPTCFVDTHASGQFDGFPIIHTPFFLDRKPHDQLPLILITSGAWREIETLLRKKRVSRYLVIPSRFLVPSGIGKLIGEKNIDPCLNPLFHDLFPPGTRTLYEGGLRSACDLLAEPEDRHLFHILTGDIGETRSRLDLITAFYYRSALRRQYFDFIDYRKVTTIIEGGAADGADTLAFLEAAPEKCRIYGFEPNFSDFRNGRYHSRLAGNPNVLISPAGLWSSTGNIYFSVSGFSSRIIDQLPENASSENYIAIPVISIDQWVREQGIKKIDFIKMDIEGAELEALRGAVHTLKRDRPQLAICIYHKPEHFFQIPLFLAEHLPDYIHRLGHYSAGALETVWFSIPAEIARSEAPRRKIKPRKKR